MVDRDAFPWDVSQGSKPGVEGVAPDLLASEGSSWTWEGAFETAWVLSSHGCGFNALGKDALGLSFPLSGFSIKSYLGSLSWEEPEGRSGCSGGAAGPSHRGERAGFGQSGSGKGETRSSLIDGSAKV